MPPAARDAPYWPNWDIARAVVLSTPTSGYVLDGFGGIHPFAAGSTADPPGVSGAGYWPNWDIARGLVLSTPTSGYQLDGFGGIHPFAGGGASMPPAPDGRAAYWPGWDIARSITLAGPSTGYVLDGWGGIHPFAPSGVNLPGVSGTTLYWPGWDVFDAVAFDPATGTGVDVNAAYLDGSGDTLSVFQGPITKPVSVASGVSLSAVGGSGARFASGAGAMLMIKLKRRGHVTIVITETLRGRFLHGRCRAAARHGRRCTRTRFVARETFKAARGTNQLPLPTSRLRPGHYTATITEHTGKTTKHITFHFTMT